MSKVTELNTLESQQKATASRIEELSRQIEAEDKITDYVRQAAEESGLSLLEICYSLVPSLERKGATTKVSTQADDAQKQQRRTKRYTNPNNNEVIETKGGNHKGLQEWKKEFGSDTVESWAKFV